jgi:hypothetical protein
MLSKESSEYRSNGHYVINGENWMSVWTYKKNNGIEPMDSASNSAQGKEMHASYEAIASKPDFGNYDKIYLYNDSDLNTYYRG